MSEPNSQGEPTMEEILASIRKIISEDGPDAEAEAAEAEASEAVEEPPEAPAQAPEEAEPAEERAVAAAAPAEPAAEDEDVLDLTQEVKEDGTVVDLMAKRDESADAQPEPEPEPEPEAAAPESDLELSDMPDEMAGAAEEPAVEEPEQAEAPDIAASAAIQPPAEESGLVSDDTRDAATASLVELAMTAGLGAAGPRAAGASGQTLEMLVRDALQPYLKSWLDENLAPLVERIVREEIQKMVKRAEYR